MGEPQHEVEMFRVGFAHATEFGWQCLNCDEEMTGWLTAADAELDAEKHGRVVAY
jgi:hypothetical protein